MDFIFLPSEYIERLHKNNQRKKSRAFMEYFYDMHEGNINSEGFYAKSWDISSSTAHNWIKEFKEEIDKFFKMIGKSDDNS